MTEGIIVDRGGEYRFKGAVRTDDGSLDAVTGWCKTSRHPEKVLLDEGAIMIPTVLVDELEESDRLDLRIVPWSTRDLRSAIQKLIRRSHVQEAVDVAYTLAGDSSGTWWLAMRTPIFAVEDVGWEWLGALPTTRISESEALEVIRWMAAVPKSGESGALHMVASSHPPTEDSVEGYTSAMLRLQKAGRMPEVEKTLKAHASTDLGARIVDKAMWRAAQRAMDDDVRMLICGASLAVCDRIETLPMEIPQGEVTPKTVTALPWWCFDSHSDVGSKAAQKVAKAHGMKKADVAGLWFCCESLAKDPVRESRWDEQGMDLLARAFGFVSIQSMRDQWLLIREEIKEAVEEGMPR